MCRKGQATIELVTGIVAGVALLVGSVKIFNWLDTMLVERQESYQADRVAAASTSPGKANPYSPPYISLFNEFAGRVPPPTHGGGVVPRSPCTAADPLLAQAEALYAQSELLWQQVEALAIQAEQLAKEADPLFQEAKALTQQLKQMKQTRQQLEDDQRLLISQAEQIANTSWAVIEAAYASGDWSAFSSLSPAQIAELQRLAAEIVAIEQQLQDWKSQLDALRQRIGDLVAEANAKIAQAQQLWNQADPLIRQAEDLEQQALALIAQAFVLCGSQGT